MNVAGFGTRCVWPTRATLIITQRYSVNHVKATITKITPRKIASALTKWSATNLKARSIHVGENTAQTMPKTPHRKTAMTISMPVCRNNMESKSLLSPEWSIVWYSQSPPPVGIISTTDRKIAKHLSWMVRLNMLRTMQPNDPSSSPTSLAFGFARRESRRFHCGETLGCHGSLQNFCQMPIPRPHKTGKAKKQREIHASLAWRGPTKNKAMAVQPRAGGSVTIRPITMIIPGKKGILLSVVFRAIIVHPIEANHPAAQRATTIPSTLAHFCFFGFRAASTFMAKKPG